MLNVYVVYAVLISIFMHNFHKFCRSKCLISKYCRENRTKTNFQLKLLLKHCNAMYVQFISTMDKTKDMFCWLIYLVVHDRIYSVSIHTNAHSICEIYVPRSIFSWSLHYINANFFFTVAIHSMAVILWIKKK